jgi:hypothetical protein
MATKKEIHFKGKHNEKKSYSGKFSKSIFLYPFVWLIMNS